MDLNRNDHEPHIGSSPRQQWLAPEIDEFDILQTTRSGPGSVSDGGALS